MIVSNLQLKNHRTPTVSVVIPTFNRATFVSEAVASVLKQSYQKFELIVIDDGSTDSTAEIVNSFKDQRLIFIKQENRGRSAARNRAIALSRGTFITFLDSDDVYLVDKLERQVHFMESHPDIAMTYTSALCMNESGDLFPEKYEATVCRRSREDIAFYLPSTITLPTVMVRREVFDSVGGFDESMSRFEDTDMWRRISRCHRIEAIQEYTCKLRTHRDNCLSSQDPDYIHSALDYYASKILREDSELSILARRRGVARIYLQYGYALWTVLRWKHKGRRLLFAAFRYWPLVFLRPSTFRFLFHLNRLA